MKQNMKKMPKWMIVSAALLLVLIAVVVMSQKKEPVPDVPQTEPAATAVVETTEAAVLSVEVEKPVVRDYDVVELVDGEIQTPYGTLNYPEGLTDFLLVINTSRNPYTLEFYAVMEGKDEVRLFDISLGEGSGGNMGMVMTPEGEVPLNVMIYTLTVDESWTEGELLTAYAMQDVVNEMIDQMAPKMEEEVSDSPIISQQPEEAGTIHNLEIETPYVTLYYPARWAGNLSFVYDESQEEVYKVHFYGQIDGHEDTLLFTLYFGGDEGEQLGAVMSEEGIPVPVNLLMEELNLEGMSDEDAQILYSMQEASNQLIERLPLLQ